MELRDEPNGIIPRRHRLIRNTMHLAHGLRASLARDGTLRIWPIGNQYGLQYKGVDPARFGEIVVASKLLIIGTESVYADDEQERVNWVPASAEEARHKDGLLPDQLWGTIGYGAHREKNSRAEELAEAISFYHKSADISIRRISEDYHGFQRHLQANSTPVGHRFATLGVFDLYSDLHSLFVSLASLRDHLALYVAEVLTRIGKISGHSALLKRLNDLPSDVQELLQPVTRKEGPLSLAHVGEYRDIVVHRRPLSTIDPDRVKAVELGGALPEGSKGASVQLPGNPFNIAGSERVDSLVIAHHFSLLLNRYSMAIANLSPIKPRMPSFTVVDGKLEEVLD